jgi:predicted nucleic acid-binding protein
MCQQLAAIIADMATWCVVRPNEADVLSAIDATSRWRISFWDAMILTAAQSVGASVVWSEDLNADQTFDGLTVRNPFAAS